MPNRVTFLVDGFNLYFSVRHAEKALRTAKRVFPGVQVCVAFPHARFNAELQQIADFSFRIRAARYANHQFPDPVRLPDGRIIRRPRDW